LPKTVNAFILRDSLAAILRFPILAYALPGAPALTAAHVITLSGWNNSSEAAPQTNEL
jgi:hypothetical protein